ncbi:MAG: hypothetical protein E6700_04335 [Winkia neuii]|uniref:Secreted protein n=1 Tax=Winkia neuii TaxID=33007 RepID=A0A2I1INB6_9ACTO|nr:hypothetical protein [Winkia neuii]MDK8099151.1 hypothetical protein [Winkia neuii]MDU3134787.1 hypothetical protein [Winkia neuii]OFK01016.1 hypothetical protein HMPREF2835_11055 [Actinomyces sp. HMSC072A03]PKY72620.1 hypothetical protein CYJ19_02950 [Winkia neuii]
MKLTRVAGAVGGSALLLSVVAAPAMADTIENDYPETPQTNAKLPIVHTSHGSDHIKANIVNPHPVCNPWEDHRTVVYKVTDKFFPVGTISATNKSKNTIPLKQSLSKSQSVSISVNGSQSETLSINLGGSTKVGKDGNSNAGIAYTLAKEIGGSASYSLSWQVGQDVGPYDVPAGYTGEATYGFRTISMTGTQQFCKLNGTWSNPTAWRAFVPVKNEVQMKLYNNPADSH